MIVVGILCLLMLIGIYGMIDNRLQEILHKLDNINWQIGRKKS